MDELYDDLLRRVWALQTAWRAVSELADDGTDPGHLAARWAASLRGTGRQNADAAAYQVLRYLVSEHEATTVGFWGSELGRTIVRVGYAPTGPDGETVSASIAAAILGVTRQRVFELQRKGRYRTPAQVCAALLERVGADRA